MVEICQHMCHKQPPYYEVMIYNNAVVPCENVEGSNVNLGDYIFEIFIKTYKVNSELQSDFDHFFTKCNIFLVITSNI